MKNYALRRLSVIARDIAEAGEWYEEQNPGVGLADALDAEVSAAVEALRTDAALHRIRFRDVRRAPLRRFAFYGTYDERMGRAAARFTGAATADRCATRVSHESHEQLRDRARGRKFRRPGAPPPSPTSAPPATPTAPPSSPTAAPSPPPSSRQISSPACARCVEAGR